MELIKKFLKKKIINKEKIGDYALRYDMTSGWSSNAFMIYFKHDEPYLIGFRQSMLTPYKLTTQEWEDLQKTLTKMSKKWSKKFIRHSGCDFPHSKVTLNFGEFSEGKTFYDCRDVEYLLTDLYNQKAKEIK